MKKLVLVILSVLAIALIGSLGYLNWTTSSTLKAQNLQLELQREQSDRQIALILLGQVAPTASTLEGLTLVSKIYIAQISIPGGSSHLYAFIRGQWFDLGEGQITPTGENATSELQTSKEEG